MNEVVALPSDAIHVGSGADEGDRREKLLGLVQHFPNVLDAIRKVSPADTFRVVMSGKNAHLFQQAADGTYPPVLRIANGRIQEHTHLVQTGVNVFSAVPNLILSVAMATIAHKLSVIDTKLEHLTQLLTVTQRGRLQGQLIALAVAQRMSVATERRAATLSACHDLVREVPASIGQLRALIAAMPEAKTGFFEGLLGSGFVKAERAYRAVQDEMQVIVHSTRALLEAYAELDEPDAAREALQLLVAEALGAGLPAAIGKARLLPARLGQPAPETNLEQFKGGMALIGATILTNNPEADLFVSIDLQPRELCFV